MKKVGAPDSINEAGNDVGIANKSAHTIVRQLISKSRLAISTSNRK